LYGRSIRGYLLLSSLRNHKLNKLYHNNTGHVNNHDDVSRNIYDHNYNFYYIYDNFNNLHVCYRVRQLRVRRLERRLGVGG